jgi:site-specific DNA recombinase
MKTSLNDFASFGTRMKRSTRFVDSPLVVAYSRVSSKEQHDSNLSLETQNSAMEEYAKRTNKTIVARFGGTYESAKTDGRKEFQRMLDYIAKNKGKVSQILVYLTDRFSRTGGAAIKLAEDLRQRYGVTIYAIAQPTDTREESGVFSQNLQFLFSHYDNNLRRKRTIDGMRAKFEKGEWVTQVPQGYDIIKTNRERKIVINADGRKLRKAFLWKAEGMKNEEIISRLKAMGVPMYKQQLTKIFKKPFYCGIIAHGMLDGKLVEGNHEPLVSQEIFLRVNDIHKQTAGYGVPHKKEDDNLPLKVFVKCAECSEPFTGYIVRAKNLHYYKCRKNGCRCNKSAKELHSRFADLMETYTVKDEVMSSLQFELCHVFDEIGKGSAEQEIELKQQLTELDKRIDTIQEKHYVLGEMSKEMFHKFYVKYTQERSEIIRQMEDCQLTISNHSEAINEALHLSTKLNTVWASGDIKLKENLQKLIFPDGISYDRKTGAFRTEKVNSIFYAVASSSNDCGGKKKGTNSFFERLSPSADRTGLEPATSAVTGRHSNQLNYRSKNYKTLISNLIPLIPNA